MDLPSLPSSFCNFLNAMRSPNNAMRLGAKMLKGNLPTPAALLDRAFFLQETVHARLPTMLFSSSLEMKHPFASYWLVYRTGNGLLGYIDNALHVSVKQGEIELDFYCSQNSNKLWAPGTSVTLRDGKMTPEWLAAQPLVVQEYLPEFALMLTLITENAPDTIVEREEFSPDALIALNDRRGRQGKRRLPPFIAINQKPRPETIARDSEGGGWTQRPHHRRGHWRTYKRSGKRVWVRDHAIHGGTDTPRHYLV